MSFRNFEEFYPFYLGEHADRTSRRLHVFATSAAVLQLLAAVLTREPLQFFSDLLTGYGFAWVGYYVCE